MDIMSACHNSENRHGERVCFLIKKNVLGNVFSINNIIFKYY